MISARVVCSPLVDHYDLGWRRFPGSLRYGLLRLERVPRLPAVSVEKRGAARARRDGVPIIRTLLQNVVLVAGASGILSLWVERNWLVAAKRS